MAWIKTLGVDQACGRLARIYERIKGPAGHIDNIMRAHSLRPHSLEGHMALYKSVLHHNANALPRWLLELVGVYVSRLNACDYCVKHHREGLAKALGDRGQAERLETALGDENAAQELLGERERAVLSYAQRLTLRPSDVDETQIRALRKAGLDDGEILEVNQVASYFAYANRTVLGLGVVTDGEPLGLAPEDSENPEDWSHC